MPGTTAVKIPVLLQVRERRSEERFVAAMPVQVNGQGATTEDLSLSGLSFIAAHPYPIGAHVDVVVEYLLDGHNYPLACEAEVVSVQDLPEGWRIGARLAPASPLADACAPAND
jgi:hypothetical protein